MQAFFVVLLYAQYGRARLQERNQIMGHLSDAKIFNGRVRYY